MKKVEQEKKQEMKLSRLQAVQRVKQYKQVRCNARCTLGRAGLVQQR